MPALIVLCLPPPVFSTLLPHQVDAPPSACFAPTLRPLGHPHHLAPQQARRPRPLAPLAPLTAATAALLPLFGLCFPTRSSRALSP